MHWPRAGVTVASVVVTERNVRSMLGTTLRSLEGARMPGRKTVCTWPGVLDMGKLAAQRTRIRCDQSKKGAAPASAAVKLTISRAFFCIILNDTPGRRPSSAYYGKASEGEGYVQELSQQKTHRAGRRPASHRRASRSPPCHAARVYPFAFLPVAAWALLPLLSLPPVC